MRENSFLHLEVQIRILALCGLEASVAHNQMKTRPALSDVSANAEFARQA